jgi:hypothetical protein
MGTKSRTDGNRSHMELYPGQDSNRGPLPVTFREINDIIKDLGRLLTCAMGDLINQISHCARRPVDKHEMKNMCETYRHLD